jgi:hypothetical protein
MRLDDLTLTGVSDIFIGQAGIRTLGALLGPLLIHIGVITNALVTVGINFGGLLLLAVFVRPAELSEQTV